jgi:hypothetical protein
MSWLRAPRSVIRIRKNLCTAPQSFSCPSFFQFFFVTGPNTYNTFPTGLPFLNTPTVKTTQKTWVFSYSFYGRETKWAQINVHIYSTLIFKILLHVHREDANLCV